MSKIAAKELQVNDFVSFTSNAIPGYTSGITLSGMIKKVMDYNIRGTVYKFCEIFTETGVRTAYLDYTLEVTKLIMEDSERELAIVKNQMRNLPRVVDQQGSDPEIFIVDKDNAVIPSFLFLKSNKDPNIIPETRQPLFWDGFQAEFNLPAHGCLDASVSSTWYGLKHLDMLAKIHDKDARLTIIPTMDIPPHMLRDNKEEHVQFGCMPSKNVYDMAGKKEDGRDVQFRSAGGHIHLQLNSTQKERIPEYVKALDAILGVACVSMFGQFDDARRREYYGLAGEYRTPKHGMEYRVLSNVWMAHPTSMYIVYELARKIISLVDNNLFKYWQADEKITIECINECNIPLACELIKINEGMFKDILHGMCYHREDFIDVVYKTFMLGLESLIPNVDDVYGNWKLNVPSPTTGLYRIAELENKKEYKQLIEIKF